MPKAIWKGGISFGLVYIPIKLYSGASPSSMMNVFCAGTPSGKVGGSIGNKSSDSVGKERQMGWLFQETFFRPSAGSRHDDRVGRRSPRFFPLRSCRRSDRRCDDTCRSIGAGIFAAVAGRK